MGAQSWLPNPTPHKGLGLTTQKVKPIKNDFTVQREQWLGKRRKLTEAMTLQPHLEEQAGFREVGGGRCQRACCFIDHRTEPLGYELTQE